MKLAELQALAAQRGLKGTSRMRKAELAQMLSGGAPAGSAKAEPKKNTQQEQKKAEPKEASSAGSETTDQPRGGQDLRQSRRQGDDGGEGGSQQGRQSAERIDGAEGSAELDVRSAVARDLAQEQIGRAHV